MLKKAIVINQQKYSLSIYKKKTAINKAPRLVLVSYQPNLLAQQIVKACIKSIIKYTVEPYSLWAIDNNSPKKNIQWLINHPQVNVVLNHNQYAQKGSYQNAIGLEIAKEVISPKSKYLMTLHMDTLVCHYNWLQFLLSKINKKTRAVGVRMDKLRTKNGVLHILGALFDFQLLKKLNVSFLPELPKYDVGDLITIKFRQAGYQVYACQNTHSDPSLIETLSGGSLYKNLNVDRTLNDNHQVFFLHLGRGIIKSQTRKTLNKKTSVKQWLDFANNFVLTNQNVPQRLSYKNLSPQFSNLSYSIRRYYVDEFYTRQVKLFPKNAKILDIGGKKINKRGQFNIKKYSLKVKYLNINPKTKPDYLCNASNIPVKKNSFDGIILAEILEHVFNPESVLKETYRILKKDGKALIATPFMYRIHKDPSDYARYTDQFWERIAKKVGFAKVKIEYQGTIYAVFANLIKIWAYEKVTKEPFNNAKFIILNKIVSLMVYYLMRLDKRCQVSSNQIYRNNTTGFGIILEK